MATPSNETTLNIERIGSAHVGDGHQKSVGGAYEAILLDVFMPCIFEKKTKKNSNLHCCTCVIIDTYNNVITHTVYYLA